jgi:hypothetical protein
MAETADYDPGDWKGYDFTSARATYDAHVGRSYTDAVSKKVVPATLVPDEITTNSTAPLVIVTDHTGSMGDWTATVFSKLPYLDLEGKEYLGDDMEISFAAVGDVFADQYPLQVQPFASGTALAENLKKLVIEGNGGGQHFESYDIAAAYYARNCHMPNAVKPVLVFIGDEGLYETVDQEHATTWARTLCEGRMHISQIMKELKQKFSVYVVLKPYGSGYKDNKKSELDQRIEKQWIDLLGEDHVCYLADPTRVVDSIFGILAKETGRYDYFKEELTGRQKPDQVAVVLKSLHSIHAALPAASMKKLTAGKSITRRRPEDDDDKPKMSKKLI